MPIQNPSIRYPVAIKQGFPRTIGLLFSVGTLAINAPLDLALYRIRCGVKRNVEAPQLEIIAPTIFVPAPADGWAFLTFTAEQTSNMIVGEWLGNVVAQSFSDDEISHEFDLYLEIQRSYAMP
jgi:hypothetical protein